MLSKAGAMVRKNGGNVGGRIGSGGGAAKK
jgi:hypothetical protein